MVRLGLRRASISGEAPNNLRLAYSPDGRIVIYGANAKGDLVTAYQPKVGGRFRDHRLLGPGRPGWGDFQLCMTDETTFHILANVDGKAYQIVGSLRATENDSLAPVQNFTGKLKQVALGYWNPAKSALTFLLVEIYGVLHAWTEGRARHPKDPWQRRRQGDRPCEPRSRRESTA